MLLPANKELAGKKIMKIAIRISDTNDIYYFEDRLPNKFSFDNMEKYFGSPSEEEIELIEGQERWYMPYCMVSCDQEDTVDEGIEDLNVISYVMDNITDSGQQIRTEKIVQEVSDDIMQDSSKNQGISLFATSPDKGVHVAMFTNVGNSLYTYDEYYGYYKRSVEWPAGTGNVLTAIIKWQWITDEPVTGGDGVIGVKILNEAQYLWVKATDEIRLDSKNSHIVIKNVYLDFGLLTEKSDMITYSKAEAKCNSSTVNVNWKCWVGLLPNGKTFNTITSLLTSVKMEETKYDSEGRAYGNKIGAFSPEEYPRSHKSYLVTSKYLRYEDDYFSQIVTVKKPADYSKYYTYTTKTKYIGYNFKFDLYIRNAAGSYSLKATTATKTLKYKYS